MTDISAATLAAPIRASFSHQRSAWRRWVGAITREELNAFTGLAILIAIIASATAVYGLAGLITVYVALVPVCLIALVAITLGD